MEITIDTLPVEVAVKLERQAAKAQKTLQDYIVFVLSKKVAPTPSDNE